MRVEVQLCSQEDKYIINNIYPLYLHDLSEVWERRTNRYGVFEENETRTLSEQNLIFDVWWEHPGVLFPYLIKVDGLPAGLAFVATAPYMPCPDFIDYYMNEFFLLRYYRGKGIGKQVVQQLIGDMPGHWEVHTNPTERNGRAIQFWRRTLKACATDEVTEEVRSRDETGHEEMLVFQFAHRK